MEGLKVNIRGFEPGDKQAVRGIVHDTALIGEPASLFFEGREAFSDALTLYFTDYEPQSCFVAEISSRVIGCLIGAKDKLAAEKAFQGKIAPGLISRAFRDGVFLKKKNLIFIFNCFLEWISGRMFSPDFSKDYPATLHINVSKEFRGQDIGSGLIDSYLSYLKEERVRGVHFATMSDSAANFFSGKGFKLLYTGKRSYFRNILHRDLPFYIYGMQL